MFRGKLVLFLILLLSVSAHGQTRTKGKVKRSVARVNSAAEAREVRKMQTGWTLGGGYIMWNEEMKLSQAGSENSGFANYGGYSLSLERFWISETWLHSINLSIGMGKAASGGFTGTPAFVDGINRAWMAAGTSLSSYRRLNSIFMAGLGLMVRYRNADWDPKDATLTVNSGSKMQVAGQIHLRWRITPHFTFIQTYTPLNFRNSTLWNWSANYEF